MALENDALLSSCVGGRDGDHVRQRGRELERVALLELVAGGGDRDDPLGHGEVDLDLLRRAQRDGEP